MAKIANDITELIGNTPLVKINKLFPDSQPPYWPSSSSTTRPRASRTVSLSRSLTRLRLPASSIREARLLKPRPVIQVSVWLWLARLAATRSSSRCPRQCRRSAAHHPSAGCRAGAHPRR
ncbi:cysteine synthase [Cutibacterium acnes JCM 18920]|nr:cysteine synthase [Cutibacterium acnes JCM 18920]